MSASSTRTTRSKPITAASKRGCDRCAESKTLRSLRTVAAGQALVQNLRRGHYELTVDLPEHDHNVMAFAELAGCL